MTSVRLSQTHPTTGRRKGYRERWALVDGRFYYVHADSLDGVWFVEEDTEHLSGAESLALIASGAWWSAIAMTLAEARAQIA